MAFDEFKGDFAPLVRMVHNHAKNLSLIHI